MKFEINDKIYDVVIVKKNNKNSYIRVKDDMTILVTTGYFTTKREIMNMLNKNIDGIKKMLNRQLERLEKTNSFFHLGKCYDIIEVSIMDDIEIKENFIYIPNKKQFDKWYKNQLNSIFNERLRYNYELFKEINVYPTLKIRKMKTRWGVYNRKNYSITLNSQLLEYDLEKIDYVIIHELSHIIHFDHSKNFWNLVSKYCPNYKMIRKELKK